MYNKLVIATHGTLAQSLLETATLIMGVQKDVHTLGLQPGMDAESFKEQIMEMVDEAKGADVLILLDLLAGTPFNSIIGALSQAQVYFVTGVNLPMLLEVLVQRDALDGSALCALAKQMGVFGIKDKDDVLKKSHL